MVLDSWSSTGATVVARFDAPSLRPPFRHAVFHPVSAEAPPSQQIYRIERHHTVRTAAISDDVATLPQLAQTLAEIWDRHGDSAWDVGRHVLFMRADVNQRDFAGSNTAHEFVVINWFQRAALRQVLAGHLLDFCQPGLCQTSQPKKEFPDVWVSEPVRHVQAGLLSLNQAGASEHLQMVRGRSDALTGLVGERFDRPCALGQEIEEFKAIRARRGLADTRQLLVDRDL
jgi:hypothetical protein